LREPFSNREAIDLRTRRARGGSKLNLTLRVCGNTPRRRLAPLSGRKKQNLPFPFSKKLGGAKKRIKTQRQF